MNENPILSQIHSPDDVKQLEENRLGELATEIRRVLVETVSQTGGHLASNLGVVELTIALHRVFDSPRDQIVFDVGHQAYTHKLLTGRYSQFSTLRTENGLSGFERPNESEHDIFYSGHSSTSISSAYGLSAAKKLAKDDHYVIAVIGDGALTGGLAYEGLNNAGRTHSRLIVILNDNEMSISHNVGSMARYLAVIRSKPGYFRLKARIEGFLNHIPLVGRKISNLVFRSKSVLKNLIYQSTIFEDMGFQYMGPIDGHNLEQLQEALEGAKMLHRPVLLHINTVKGKGYDFAEREPNKFHGISKFDINTGEPVFSRCLAGRCVILRRRMSGFAPSRLPWRWAQASTLSARRSLIAFLMWGSRRSTRSPLPPVWPKIICCRCLRYIQPFCSVVTIS